MIKLVNYWLFSVPVDFEISWGKILFSRHLIVKLQSQNKIGVGEGVLYKTNGLSAQRFTFKIAKMVNNEQSISNLQKKIQKFFPQAPGVVCAFDLALWDLKSKLNQKPLCQILGKPVRKKIKITEQIFIKDKKKTISELKKVAKNQTNLKLKISRDFKKDLRLLKKIRKKYSRLNLQVDANQSLSPKKLQAIDKILQKLNIKALEEPVSGKHWFLFNQLKTPIILDESISSLRNLKNAHKKKAINILNIKLSRLGGITNSLKFVKFCQQNNVNITLGCSEELGIGTAAILHLSSTIKNLYSTEGLGPKRLGFNIINEQFKLKKGFINLPQKIGLGVTFNPVLLKKSSRTRKFPILEKETKSLIFNLIESKNILKNKITNLFILLKTRLVGLK